MHVEGDLDLADAIDLNTALAADAHQQLLAGSTESLDVRRSIAAGNLARNQLTLDLDTGDRAAPRRRKREVVLHVHLEHAAVARHAGGLARVQETPGPVTAEQVRHWCGKPETQITVQPVLDLAEHIHVNAYQASGRLKLQTQLRDRDLRLPVLLQTRREAATANTGSPTRTADRPAPATSRRVVGDTTAPRPPAAGATSPSNPASTCGEAPWATSSSATTPAPSTSPPTTNADGSPTSSARHFGDTDPEP